MGSLVSPALAPPDVLAWDDDRLLVTSSSVNTDVRRPRLSASVAKSVSSCAARYVGERVLRMGVESEDPFAPAPVGTVAHTVMERLMQLARTKRTPLAARRIMYQLMVDLTSPNPDKHWPGLPVERTPEWLALVDSAFMGLFGIVDPRKIVVHKTELRLDDVFIGGVPFKGFIDMVSQAEDDDGRWLEIVDYKTGARLPYTPFGAVNDHHDQIRMYRIGLAQKLGSDKRFRGSVYYTRDKLAKSVRVPMRGPDLDATTRRFQSAWRRMNSYADDAAWPAKATPLCGWCPLVATCPTAARERKVARIEGLPTAVDLPIPVRRHRPSCSPAGRSGEDDWAAHESDARHGLDREDLDYDALHADLAGQDGDGRTDCQAVVGPGAGLDAGDRIGTTTKETNMGALLYEDKPFLEVPESRDTLNPNSFAAIGVFGIVSMTVEQLSKAGLPLTARRVRGLARLFGSIVAEVQRDYTGSTNWQQGMNTRARGALHTTVDSLPVPLTGTADDLRGWHEAARKRVAAICRFSVELWDDGEATFDGDYAAVVGG
ncbi:RecB family exonuclease [Nakamurella multipartita]|uniref:PD-(D/E)XK endonuclease-like domain-containing protein n=1 Tax=Nakamurella multipartita (strain ATCC 700099 / DSM 44233 / CIP 104796 / JCM 9543 / NBRC 105858 / Y-104) TaxID=479431 RepID=C8X8K3_NAKMY|nr:PD-(D/E)XK nuclease family protein [Nakamurella multipartita]ACV79058.1 hypothetical protein Namu_2712 [Nakamurella multipartita DSM 44233]